jgi:hypothetical protein
MKLTTEFHLLSRVKVRLWNLILFKPQILLLEIKPPDREDEHPLPSSVQVMNMWHFITTPSLFL